MTKRLAQALLTIVLALAASNELRAQDGGALFSQLCSTCHDGGNERAPKREVLWRLTPEQVLDALEVGSMITMAAHRSTLDHRAIDA
jgi:hypothetical protein